MGGAVSSGESNDDLIDNLLEADYIKSPMVERVFRAVDRAFYYTEPYKQNAYKDLAWKDGNLHLSAPCIYSEVLENLELKTGHAFLNVGSGTGYFSTMCGLILGKGGVNHGIELYPDVVNYARTKLEEFLNLSPAIDEFDFCLPEFTVGNCLDSIPASKRYDRIYCGAACPNNYVGHLVDMLKVGGICVVPLGDSLMQITRTEEKKDERKALLPVSFATLISPKENGNRTPVELPEWSPKTLTELCRSEIRSSLRQTISLPEPKSMAEENRKKKRKRRQERRRASRLVVVQRRRSGGEVDGDNGFVAIAYSMGSNSSDEDRHPEVDREENHQEVENNGVNGTSSEDSSPDGNGSPSRSEQEDEADAIMDEELKNNQDASPPDSNNSAGSSGSLGESSTSAVRNGGVAVVTGSAPIFSAPNVKKADIGNGASGGRNDRRAERRSASASSARGRAVVNGNSRPTRSARNYTTGAETLLGRIRELVRARQHDLESMRRQFQRSDSDAENNTSRNGSNNRDESNLAGLSANGNGVHPDLTSSSDSSPSPSVSASSTSVDEAAGAENLTDNTKKRCRNESSDEEKKMSAKEPKPDPLLVNVCSVQMRKKILDLPLPPALKVYLNYERKLYY